MVCNRVLAVVPFNAENAVQHASAVINIRGGICGREAIVLKC
jgi:hypothetical protein